LQYGDDEAYERHRESMLKQFANTSDPILAERTAKACLLLPCSGNALDLACTLAEKAVLKGAKHEYFDSFLFSSALARYRQGDCKGAASLAAKVLENVGKNALLEAQTHFLLALALRSLDQTEEARLELVKGAHLVGELLPKLTSGNLDDSWHDLLIAHILMREANAQEGLPGLERSARAALAAGKLEMARTSANHLLKLAAEYNGNWQYGNILHEANLILGHISVREGRIDEAAKYLLSAGSIPGSPQLDSFGPNMSLAKILLEKGQRDPVLMFFKECAVFWKSGGTKLDEWTKEVAEGKIPDFGPNLLYHLE
jgi:hypothetical protein